MSVDIREYTRVIIRRNGQYLFCVSEFTKKPEWRDSPYDAWHTRDMNCAKAVANVLRGEPMLFNPAVGKVAMCRG